MTERIDNPVRPTVATTESQMNAIIDFIREHKIELESMVVIASVAYAICADADDGQRREWLIKVARQSSVKQSVVNSMRDALHGRDGTPN